MNANPKALRHFANPKLVTANPIDPESKPLDSTPGQGACDRPGSFESQETVCRRADPRRMGGFGKDRRETGFRKSRIRDQSLN